MRLRESATHITNTPTKTTMIVAINGTIKFKSNQCGIHGGKYVLPFSCILLSGGASVPTRVGTKKNTTVKWMLCTFMVISFATKDANYNYGYYND